VTFDVARTPRFTEDYWPRWTPAGTRAFFLLDEHVQAAPGMDQTTR